MFITIDSYVNVVYVLFELGAISIRMLPMAHTQAATHYSSKATYDNRKSARKPWFYSEQNKQTKNKKKESSKTFFWP